MCFYAVLLFDSLSVGGLGHDGKYRRKLPPAGKIVELKVKILQVGQRFLLSYHMSLKINSNIDNINCGFKEAGFENVNNMSPLVLILHTFTHLRVPVGRICLLLSIMGSGFFTGVKDLDDTGASF